ncbi:THO complex subunit 5 [Batrachochytrium dendrobatidis]|nr:THO complex subunit 5 [Batrachochytrium dendrobatidis]KAK5667891.1 THO complex subunit 5 [Batrachochytrium dendrobatidis]
MPTVKQMDDAMTGLSSLHRHDIDELFDEIRRLAIQAVADRAACPSTESISTAAGDDYINRGNLLFIELQQLSRASFIHSKTRKEQSTSHKQAMDQTQLTLQNLNYERMHYLREIAKCESFETTYQDIPLLSEKEFIKLAPSEYTTESALQDAHTLMLNHLWFELKQRKDMQDVLAAHNAQKVKVEAENKVLSESLDQLDLEIDTLLKSTIPLQKKFKLNTTRERNLSEKSLYLASPMFVLYKHFAGYCSMYEEQGLFVDIIGDTSKAGKRRLITNSKQAESGVDEMEETSGKRHNNVENIDQIYEHHPMGIVLSFTDSIKMVFNYIPVLNIVIVSAQLGSDTGNLPANYLLHGLVPQDDGLTSPNPANQFLMQGSFTFDVVKAGGMALQWAQAISGASFPLTCDISFSDSRLWINNDSTSSLLTTAADQAFEAAPIAVGNERGSRNTSKPNIPFVTYLAQRVKIRAQMLYQLTAVVDSLCCSRVYLPSPKRSTLVGTLPEYRMAAMERIKVNVDSILLSATVEISGRVFQICVTIPASYPESRSLFSITKEFKMGQNDTNDIQFPTHIELIETALNESPISNLMAHFDGPDTSQQLVASLTKLIYCLKAYTALSSDNSTPPCSYTTILG